MEIVQIALWLGMVVSFLMAIIDTSHTLMYVLVGLGCFFIFPFTVEFLLCLLSPSSSPHLSPLSSEFQGKFPLIYSPKYNIETPCKFEKMHPFDSSKYRRIFNRLVVRISSRTNEIGRNCEHALNVAL